MNRDPKTGRFLPGNKTAVGNRGNRKPKWGNKNAMTHGMYAEIFLPRIRDGYLYLISQYSIMCLKPDYFYQDQDGLIWVHDEVVPILEGLGIELEFA